MQDVSERETHQKERESPGKGSERRHGQQNCPDTCLHASARQVWSLALYRGLSLRESQAKPSLSNPQEVHEKLKKEQSTQQSIAV